MSKYILGVKIDDLSIPEIVDIVKIWLSKEAKHYIVTPNPEIVMMAQKDEELKKIINNADLAIPDGVGLKLALDIENISPGIDVLEELVKMAAENGFTTGFLGGKNEVAKKTAERLIKKYAKLKVVFAEFGGEMNKQGKMLSDYRLPTTRKDGRQKAVDILFVAFGPPKQEKWIANNLNKLNVKVAMGVGGSFDYLSGQIPRAPKLMRSLGFEWLFRLIIQPWRFKRQLALIKYVLLLLKYDNH